MQINETMKASNVGAVSENIINQVKKTKNTSIKNLLVCVNHEGAEERHVIKNMCQVWKFIKNHYNTKDNLKDKITVFHNETLLKDIHAEVKGSGRLWMVDRLQIGKHVKACQ